MTSSIQKKATTAEQGDAVKRLNWGCGRKPPAGWINSDLRDDWRIDITCDIRDGLPLDTNSIDYAVSIHALPEIPYPDLVGVLTELRRVLKQGAPLRLGLPDLDKAIEAYRTNNPEYFLVPDDDAKSIGAKMVVQMIWYGYTRTIFTHDFIDEQLYKAGFSKVMRCSYRQTASSFPGITELDDRERESLFVEAVK
jgi:predicted SAM-dependent methyltransferase